MGLGLMFNDTWFQTGYLVSCTTILLVNFQIVRSDIRTHIKVGCQPGDCISFMITLIFLGGMCGYVWVNIHTIAHRICNGQKHNITNARSVTLQRHLPSITTVHQE